MFYAILRGTSVYSTGGNQCLSQSKQNVKHAEILVCNCYKFCVLPWPLVGKIQLYLIIARRYSTCLYSIIRHATEISGYYSIIVLQEYAIFHCNIRRFIYCTEVAKIKTVNIFADYQHENCLPFVGIKAVINLGCDMCSWKLINSFPKYFVWM